MILSGKLYDILKWLCLIGIPAIITFYGVLSNSLNLPYTEIVLTISTAFNTMLGTMLGISNYNYKKENK